MSVSIESWSLSRRSAGSARRGLTLMELVIVLAILAATAGILVPLLPNLLRRAHKASDATQSGELSKAMQSYQVLFVSYPDNFDMLTDGSAFPAYVPTDDAPFGGFVEAKTLSTNELKALQRVGVQFVQPLASTTAAATVAGFHPTMSPYAAALAANQADLSASTTAAMKFAVIDPTTNTVLTATHPFLQTVRNADPTARYVVFGVGARSSIIGQAIQDAPMSTPQKKTMTPDTTYARFGVIFKVSGTEVDRTERARFIAAVALEDDELESTEKDIVGYYEASRDPRN